MNPSELEFFPDLKDFNFFEGLSGVFPLDLLLMKFDLTLAHAYSPARKLALFLPEILTYSVSKGFNPSTSFKIIYDALLAHFVLDLLSFRT